MKPLSIGHAFKWLALLSLVSVSPMAMAMSVQPMVMELDPLGRNSRVVIRVENKDSAPLTIEAHPRRLEMAADGAETLHAADDDLLVFPPVAIVAAGGTQSIQVQYVGDPELVESRAYRVSIEQVPVDFEHSGTAQVGVVASMHTLLNVVPAKATPSLQVLSIAEDGDDWILEIRNAGNRYARFSETRWTVESGDRSVRLDSQELGERLDRNLILANSTLKIAFRPPPGLKANRSRVSISSQ